ncbi:MAG TPA: DUF192 domain-containing protein [Burkholderiales bacterium]|nr:DUF192 domain-containing protein [Burkholderiales bacterium]
MKLAPLALAFAAAAALAQQPSLPKVQLGAGMYLIQAEVADRDDTRTTGLMHRTSLPQNGGMLFVFDAPEVPCMWMKNTLLPLSVAFLDAGGTIVNIADMQPLSEDTHCAARPALYALEMKQGWFAERGIRTGMKLRGLEKAAPR